MARSADSLSRPPGAGARRAFTASTAALTLAVLILALAVHGIVAWQYRTDPFAGSYVSDALSYHLRASRIAEHGLAAEPVFHQSPLFPVLLSVLYSVTAESARALFSGLLQSLLTSVALALLVPLGRYCLGSDRAGLVGALLALGHGPVVFYGMKLFPVPLAMATQAAMLTSLGAARERPTPFRAGVAGCCLGLACLARAEMLLFAPVAIVALAFPVGERARLTRRKRLAAPALLLGAAAAVIAPVTAHNLRQGDRVLVASSSGENLFIGNQVDGDGGYTALDPRAGELFAQRALARSIAEEAADRTLLPSEVSSYWRGRALQEIGARPLAWLALELRKLRRLLHPGDPTDVHSFALERSLYLPALYLLPVTAWALMLLGATGCVLSWSRCRDRAWPLGTLVLVHLFVLLAFFVDTRLRLPLLFFLCPFAGLTMVEAARSWVAGRRRGAVLFLGSLTVAALIAGNWMTGWTARDAVRLAAVLSHQGRLDDSLKVLEPSISGPEPDARALDQAGWVLQRQGEYQLAREHYRLAIERGMSEIGERQTRTRLAIVLEQLGRFEQAAMEHDLAAASETANAGTFYERGTFLLRRGRREEAIRDLRQAARLDSGWPAPRETLRRLGEKAP